MESPTLLGNEADEDAPPQHYFCEECGARLKSWWRGVKNVPVCKKCIPHQHRNIADDFFFERMVVYRALRTDEDPSEGLFPRNELAQFSLEEHIEYGDIYHTQFLSFSSSPEVAMYFAIKRALQRQEWPCRVVQVKLPVSNGEPEQEGVARRNTIHEVLACVRDSWSESAKRTARLYDEICVEETGVHHSLIDKTFEVKEEEANFFNDYLEHLGEFKVQYYKSALMKRFESSGDNESHLKITSRLGKLRRDSIQLLPKGEKKVGFQLRHEPEHDIFDPNAIAVVALHDSLMTLGYVCPDHAPILIKHLAALVAYQKISIKDLTCGKEELPLTLHFRLPTDIASKLARDIRRSRGGGKVTLQPWSDEAF